MGECILGDLSPEGHRTDTAIVPTQLPALRDRVSRRPGRGTEEALDLEVLLDGLEEPLNLRTVPVDVGDGYLWYRSAALVG